MVNKHQDNLIITMRFRFKRRESLRFLSHLDQQSAFQRAFRRAGIPLAYSGGFHPHPKMAFAQAMSVGMTSDCEYGDVQLTQKMKPEDFIRLFNEAMPNGLEIISAKLLFGKVPSLTASVAAARYTIQAEYRKVLLQDQLNKSITQFLAQPEILIQKRNKKGKIKEKNIKPFIQKLCGEMRTDKIIFRLNNAFINQATVKPVQVIDAFAKYAAIDLAEPSSWRIHRNALILSDNL